MRWRVLPLLIVALVTATGCPEDAGSDPGGPALPTPTDGGSDGGLVVLDGGWDGGPIVADGGTDGGRVGDAGSDAGAIVDGGVDSGVATDGGVDSGVAADGGSDAGGRARRRVGHTFCAAGGPVSGGDMRGTVCLSPISTVGTTATGGGMTWKPGPVGRIYR